MLSREYLGSMAESRTCWEMSVARIRVSQLPGRAEKNSFRYIEML